MPMSGQFPELDFQHLLAHTFPGFFSSITLFMLLDYWSPYPLTSKIMSVEGLVGLAGFILVIGTILGIILDGIHHIVLEDGIFSNLDEIKSMYKSVDHLFPCINLKPISCENSPLESLLTPHNLLIYYYNKKGCILDVDRELIFRYYRYSEFFANTFLSLTIFSVVSPLFLFKELDISWDISVLFGLISLVISILCFEASHLAYVRYLKAQINFLAGFLDKNANNCYAYQSVPTWSRWLQEFGSSLFKALINRYNIIVSFVYLAIIFFFNKVLNLGFTATFDILIFLIIFLISPLFRLRRKYSTKSANGHLFQEIVFSYLGMLLVILIIVASYQMPHIDPNPPIFNGIYHIPKNSNSTDFTLGSIFITNRGDAVENVTAQSSFRWIDACWEMKYNNACEKDIYLHEDGNAALILNYSEGYLYPGEHIGLLIISCKTKTFSWLNQLLIESRMYNITIPMNITIYN
jgi:hypothetical protein